MLWGVISKLVTLLKPLTSASIHDFVVHLPAGEATGDDWHQLNLKILSLVFTQISAIIKSRHITRDHLLYGVQYNSHFDFAAYLRVDRIEGY